MMIRCLHQQRGDLLVDAGRREVCRRGRGRLAAQPVRSAGTRYRQRNHQLQHRYSVDQHSEPITVKCQSLAESTWMCSNYGLGASGQRARPPGIGREIKHPFLFNMYA